MAFSPRVDGWGLDPLMNGMETAMWRMDSDAALRTDVVMIWMLDRMPEWDRFLVCCAWLTRVLPRLRLRVVEPPLRIGPPIWEVDERFDLSCHVHRARLPSPGGRRELLDLAESVGSSVFDPARPPWHAVLVEGGGGEGADGAAIVIKLHHCIADGAGLRQAMLALLPRSRQASLRPLGPAPAAPRRVAPWRLSAQAFASGLGAAPGRAGRGGARLAGDLVRAAAPPAAVPMRIRRLARSLGQAATVPQASPLLAGRSRERRFEAVEMPLAELKAAGKDAGASVTAAFITVLLGAFSDYHRRHGKDGGPLSIVVPVDVRGGGQANGNNVVGGLLLGASLEDMDTHERLAGVGALLREARESPLAGWTAALTSLIPLAPLPVLLRATRRLGGAHDLTASSVPGVPYQAYIAGARLVSSLVFGPRAYGACTAVLMSQDETLGLGLNIDPAAITDAPAFGRLVHENAGKVLALASRTRPAPLART
ncbi:wax ester/triacylglycerol synthase domain-containing protein [Actinomadura macrotermitis]|uniref:diacylglycerol O-acyltransferase n=1 Tax=Actinomadura macrotermitis TaxID=2585200 RepID=A0A7K0C2J6_9ACTN|nr:wax ester/triacylglycerol synthase domain-containing protein [Actinomadura macrotermitis]MQY07651.1 putative diacylglycerol O-acyltransferase [Actinomadura macrotermitis]